jgi:hypothetical protein
MATTAQTGPAGGDVLKGIKTLAGGSYTGKLPIPNVLSRFASYNYILGLSCLTPNELNFPDESYKTGKTPELGFICKTASIDTANRFNAVGGYKLDFFMTELTINGQYGFEKSSGNTNSLTLEFTVVEPFSMGQFVTVMQVAAYQAGYTNYNDASYLITVDFRGNTETGQLVNIPNTTKHIPFKITNIDMKVTASGATYHVKGYVTNGEALNDTYATIKSDVFITGETVQEMLQSGEKSLQSILNRQFKELQKDTGIEPDQIFILFPDAISSQTSLGIAKTATISTQSSIKEKLKVSESGNNGVIKQDGAVNPIGKAPMNFDIARNNKEFPEYIATWDTDINKPRRADNKIDPKKGAFQFKQGIRIEQIINAVIQQSSYPKDAMAPGADDSAGMRAWWRIDTQVYHTPSKANKSGTGFTPKIVVYRVIPYGYHDSKMLAAGAGAPGLKELEKRVAKRYEYLYTGLNTEVLTFDLTIRNGFISAFAFDNFARNQDAFKQNKTGSVSDAPEKDKRPEIKVVNKGDPVLQGGSVQDSQSRYTAIKTNTEGMTGSPTENMFVIAGKLMHEALTTPYDMVNLNLKIVGDPYYIANSGMGNYTIASTAQNITEKGDIDFQSSESDIMINIKSPTDIAQSTGLYDFRKTQTTNMFKGFYKLTRVVSTFKDGSFTQQLSGYRRAGQDVGYNADGTRLTSATEVKKDGKAG